MARSECLPGGGKNYSLAIDCYDLVQAPIGLLSVWFYVTVSPIFLLE